MKKNQLLAAIIVSITGAAAASLAMADEIAPPIDNSGFYGGLSMRDNGSASDGLQFGHLANAWSKFMLPATDDNGTRTLAYGGYRWANDVAVEAAVASADRFALRPDANGARQGMGLALANGNEAAAKTWNVDVFTSWGFAKQFSLYGRLGYIQNEPVAIYPASGLLTDARRNGVNYGVGLRYDINRVLGLRLEYARYGRLAGEPMTGVLPESDQVQFGLQFRF